MSDEQNPVIESVLSKLKHLDLSDRLLEEKPDLVFRGGYGDVFRGKVLRKDGQGRMEVSMKQLRVSLHNGDFAKTFARELTIWAKLDHRNIVRLEGFIREGYFPTLVSPWASKGSLMGYINGGNKYNVVQMVRGIAEGLAYLHSKDIVHSDLKSENVLVDDFEQPMICDFGISRMVSYSQTILVSTSHDKLKGSLRWMAYELLMVYEGSLDMETWSLSTRSSMIISLYDDDPSKSRMLIHTKETDMWAFGMVILELISKQLPFANIKYDEWVKLAIQNKKLPKKPKEMCAAKKELWKLCLQCWNHSPSERMVIEDAINRLKHISGTLPIQNQHSLPGLLPREDKIPLKPLSVSSKVSPPMLPSVGTNDTQFCPSSSPRLPSRPTSMKSVTSVSSVINMRMRRDTIAANRIDKLEPPPERKESPSGFLEQLVLSSPPIKSTNYSETCSGHLSSLNDKPLPVIPRDDSPLGSPTATITLESGISETSVLKTPVPSASATTKRAHTLKELLTPERAYASDLAFTRNVHIPVVLGNLSPFQLQRLMIHPPVPFSKIPTEFVDDGEGSVGIGVGVGVGDEQQLSIGEACDGEMGSTPFNTHTNTSTSLSTRGRGARWGSATGTGKPRAYAMKSQTSAEFSESNLNVLSSSPTPFRSATTTVAATSALSDRIARERERGREKSRSATTPVATAATSYLSQQREEDREEEKQLRQRLVEEAAAAAATERGRVAVEVGEGRKRRDAEEEAERQAALQEAEIRARAAAVAATARIREEAARAREAAIQRRQSELAELQRRTQEAEEKEAAKRREEEMLAVLQWERERELEEKEREVRKKRRELQERKESREQRREQERREAAWRVKQEYMERDERELKQREEELERRKREREVILRREEQQQQQRRSRG